MRHRITKLTAIGLLGAGLALGSLPAVVDAQDVNPPGDRFDDRGGTDWGWIGLLGLGGLLGLMGRERRTYQSAATPGRV